MVPISAFCFYKLCRYHTIQVDDKEKYTIYFGIDDNPNVNEINKDYILSKITNISKSISRKDSEYKSFSFHKEKIDEFEIDKNDIENNKILMKICKDAIKYNNSTDINNRIPVIKFKFSNGFSLINFFGTFYCKYTILNKTDENIKIPSEINLIMKFLNLMRYDDYIDEFFDYKDPRKISVKEIRDKVSSGFDINVEFLNLFLHDDHIDKILDHKDPRKISVEEIYDKILRYKKIFE